MRKKFRFYALKLAGVMLAAFIVQISIRGFTEMFILDENSFARPWRFITAIFLHGGSLHLIFNLFALLLFGLILERFIGSMRFLIIFFSTGILANLVSIWFYDSSLGASGAIFGIIGTLIFIRPMLPIWAFGMPMPIFVAGILWAGADIFGAIGFFTGNPVDNTGNIAHLSGMLFGFLFGRIYRKLIRKKIRKVNVSLDESEVRRWEDLHFK